MVILHSYVKVYQRVPRKKLLGKLVKALMDDLSNNPLSQPSPGLHAFPLFFRGNGHAGQSFRQQRSCFLISTAASIPWVP
jgi:hypothetical protein